MTRASRNLTPKVTIMPLNPNLSHESNLQMLRYLKPRNRIQVLAHTVGVHRNITRQPSRVLLAGPRDLGSILVVQVSRHLVACEI